MKKIFIKSFFWLLCVSLFLVQIHCFSSDEEEESTAEFTKGLNIPIEAKVFFLKGEFSDVYEENDDEYPGTIYIFDKKMDQPVKLLDDSFSKLCGNFDISRDGSHIIFAYLNKKDDTWDIWLAGLDLANNQAINPRYILNSSSREEDPRFSFKGDKFVCKKDGDICVYGINLANINTDNIKNSEQNITKHSSEEEWAPAFSYDDNFIVFGRGTDKTNPKGDIVLYDLTASEENATKVIKFSPANEWFPSFNINGDIIYVFKNEIGNCNDDIYIIKKVDLDNSSYNSSHIDGINECANISDADPLMVYGDNNYLGFVSDRMIGRYGVWLYSFNEKMPHLVVSHSKNRLLGPVIYSPSSNENNQISDNFNDGSINSQLWMTGGRLFDAFGACAWVYENEEVIDPSDGYFSAHVYGPESGLTYGAEAWIRTKHNFNDGQTYTINITWEPSFAASDTHCNLFYIQVTDGYLIPADDHNLFWQQSTYSGTTDLLWDTNTTQKGWVFENESSPGKLNWSIVIDPSGIARLYNGKDASGNILRQEPLDLSYPWYIRFMVSDGTSLGYPAGNAELKLYNFD